METVFRSDFPNQFGNKFRMNFPNESAAELIARFSPKRPKRYAGLHPHAEFIRELRRNRASYDTIVAILRERHSLQVTDTTVRHFCRDILQERPGRRRARTAAQTSAAPSRQPAQTLSPRPARNPSVDGPQIAEVEFTDE
jgi:hypothetical protein